VATSIARKTRTSGSRLSSPATAGSRSSQQQTGIGLITVI
jgi:hypothetical protein